MEKKSASNPTRGFVDDAVGPDGNVQRNAQQKVVSLERMLGQIANYCPIIARNSIVKHSEGIDGIWQTIRLHFGIQTTGGHFLDFADIRLDPGEKPEDLLESSTAYTGQCFALDNSKHCKILTNTHRILM